MTSTAPPTVQYEAVIGLEVHVQLSTETKLFCRCSTRFGNTPNTNICPICTGQPGTLPVLNQQALDYAVRAATALNCQIHPQGLSKFDRKQYFYPDLPKNYQISQYDLPLAEHGWLEIEVEGEAAKRIGITRLHMEEDAGKLVHAGADRLSGSTHSLVDFNRAGVALCEIVSEPDIRSAAQAAAYAEELRRIVRYLGVCDGNMQEGSLRFDLNISVRPAGGSKFGTKVEIKNLNSFNALQRAVEYEFTRQVDCVRSGERIVQETRLWDEATQRTISMRSKEEANDYRYFPEPDLVPIALDSNQIDAYRQRLGELPAQKRHRYCGTLGLSSYDARVLTDEREVAEYFEQVVALDIPAKQAANFLNGPVAAYLNETRQSISQIKVTPEVSAELLALINQGIISNRIANELLPGLFEAGGSPRALVEERGLTQISDRGQLEEIVNEVLAGESDSVAAYRGGRTKLLGFFVGKVMKKTAGRADPQVVNDLLQSKLAEQPTAPPPEPESAAEPPEAPPAVEDAPLEAATEAVTAEAGSAEAITAASEEPDTPVSHQDAHA